MRGYTVEMSFLMPIVLLLIMNSIFGVFYFHDKNILMGAAYETVVVGSTKAREKEGASAAELEEMFRERTEGKCILFDSVAAAAAVSDDEIEIQATGTGRGMTVRIIKRMAVTRPEDKIRDVRRLKTRKNGAENNN